jgi:hypothetical protein
MTSRFLQIRDRLRYVETAAADYDLGRFPDFMIIGPLRTGTTWLHEQLVEHPEVFLPTWKEVHYFNNLEHPEYHPSELRPVKQELGWYLDQFEVPGYYAKQREAACRARYGCSFAPKVFGDGSATYALGLHAGIIEEILLLNPDIKIITMVRDPIERAWSNAKKNLSRERSRDVADVPVEEWLEFICRDFQVRTGRYSEWHPTWVDLVPEENLMIGRFIDVVRDPVTLLRRAYRLLGVQDDACFVPEAASSPVNPTASADIPTKVEERLHELFDHERDRLQAAGMI